MPDSNETNNTPTPKTPPKKRKGGWLRVVISTRLSDIDKAERELLIDPNPEDLERMTPEQLAALDTLPALTIDEWVDRVIARKKAQHRPRPGQKVARSANTPKWLRPQCGAKTRAGRRCRATPVWDKENNRPRNGRCRMHGGLSTGPKTPEGKAKALSNLKNFKGGG